jgi:hypothetical protein
MMKNAKRRCRGMSCACVTPRATKHEVELINPHYAEAKELAKNEEE